MSGGDRPRFLIAKRWDTILLMNGFICVPRAMRGLHVFFCFVGHVKSLKILIKIKVLEVELFTEFIILLCVQKPTKKNYSGLNIYSDSKSILVDLNFLYKHIFF